MSEKLSKAEKKAAKEEKKKQKREARLKSHILPCPHCGKDVLDHMTKCPYCGETLTPSNYRTMSAEKRNAIKKVTYLIGAVVAVVVIVLLLVFK
ncbi:MAG: zinc-ribbon domain-containing protein [Clostridiales bacterium]|nr:zinc-ribbon domain-containing protein [Clostridiales bacterium]